MVKHNNVLPNAHFRKDWQRRVKTWFDQPGQKKARRTARAKKAAKIAPRPLDGLLRPAVRCPTIKYNIKLRQGRGFTLQELKAAGIRRKEALAIGISVDHRRKNRSQESIDTNVNRLKEYMSKLVLIPKKAGKPKKADASPEKIAKAVQLPKGKLLPVVNDKTAVTTVSSVKQAKVTAYATLRRARSDKRYKGIREKIAKQKAEEEKNKK